MVCQMVSDEEHPAYDVLRDLAPPTSRAVAILRLERSVGVRSCQMVRQMLRQTVCQMVCQMVCQLGTMMCVIHLEGIRGR